MTTDIRECGFCGRNLPQYEMRTTWGCRYGNPLERLDKCLFCYHDDYFFSIAQYRCRTIYKVYTGEKNCPKDLIQIEILTAKIRYVLMGKDPTYVTFKTGKMITNVTNSTEMRQALNENLHALLTRKRKLLMVREVNNTLGKILTDVKMEMMSNAMSGNQNQVSWFDKPSIALPANKPKRQLQKAS